MHVCHPTANRLHPRSYNAKRKKKLVKKLSIKLISTLLGSTKCSKIYLQEYIIKYYNIFRNYNIVALSKRADGSSIC